MLASAVSAYTYHKNKNLDVKNGLIMMASVLTFTVVGSYAASLLPSATMGGFAVFMTFLLGVKFIVRPVMTTKESMAQVSAKKRAIQSVVCGVMIGYIPADQNSLASTLFHFGHRNILECRILQVDKEAAPWKQVRVGLYVTDIRPR